MSSLLALLSQNSPDLQTRKGLILIGLQNDFLSLHGKLPVIMGPGFVDRLAGFVEDFRAFGDIIWARIETESTGSPHELDSDEVNVILSEGNDAADAIQDDHLEDELGEEPFVPTKKRKALVDLSSNLTDPPTDGRKHLKSVPNTPDDANSPTEEVDEELYLTSTASRSPCCVKDTDGAALAPEITPLVQCHDLQMVQGHYSAFSSRSLLLTLRSRFITELYLCGSLTNISVFATAMDAASHGINVVLIEDCLGYRKRGRHDFAVQRLVDIIGAEVLSSASALKMLREPDLAEWEGSADEGSEGDDRYMEKEAGVRASQGSSADVLEVDSDDEKEDFELPDLPSMAYFQRDLELRPASAVRASFRETSAVFFQEKSSIELSDAGPSPPKTTNGSVDGLHFSTHDLDRSSAPVDVRLTHPPNSSEEIIADKSPKDTGADADGLRQAKTTFEPLTARDYPTSEAETVSDATLSSLKASAATPHGKKVTHTPNRHPLFGVGKGKESAESSIIYDLLPKAVADTIFDEMQSEIKWESMLHQTGQVPRLVCCQGSIAEDGSMPVYRHPSDKTVASVSWTKTVKSVQAVAEEVVGHTLNHALIQSYRSGNDFISEHSDKTLDIIPGSNIVNVSFGAERTMRLRSKRTVGMAQSQGGTLDGRVVPRTTRRVRMPHNSMVTMSLKTNAHYLHGINADKRPRVELSEAETAFEGQRISLTFRNIGTFLSPDAKMMWGQGAVGKTKSEARPVINGDESHSEVLIKGFGSENQSPKIDWEGWYGIGSDVLHLR